MLFAALLALATIFAPSSLVDTFVGTSGTPVGGPIDTFPGADLPFGMIQWSPDTPSQNAGGGYEYGDHEITGFSLTHLSGPGCNVFGDFGVLPTVGAIPADPAGARQPFSHATEQSAPGWYAVSLGAPAIRTELTVTRRTGLGRFTFPATTQANVLLNAASNQAGVTDARVQVDSANEISGSASSGFFCGMPDRYTVYFVARFDRAFRQYGTWTNGQVQLGSRAAQGPQTGIWLSFDTTQRRDVMMKVAISFVGVAGARANLAAENPDWNQIRMRDRATDLWDAALRRIAVTGGSSAQQRTFYSAFYHTLLHPNVIDDVTGLYTGFDGRVHRARAGHDEYANFSDWDIYRTEVPLLALVAPTETSDMIQSLVDAFDQEGWLPRWPLVNGTTSVMGGDSVDPVIAGAYAFGARDFDARGALRAMLKGATSTQPPPAQGWYYERWELHDDYLRRGYVVNTHTTSVSPVPNGASETLEYALDDFAIARLAAALHQRSIASAFMRRSSNWSTLFDGATDSIAPRDADGAFMRTPLTENGQSGFQEGNAAQYTWMVPQDLRDLIAAMGGDAAVDAKLDAFFAQLNAGEDKPYAWLGNEPSLGTPWVYLSAGEPWRAQQILHEALTTLYADTPTGLPGNDDLGTMSAWYVWCAIGLYPQEPAARYLDIGAPLFDSVHVASPDGTTIEVRAPQAGAQGLYIAQVTVDGRRSPRSWVVLPYRSALRLDLTMSAAPQRRWASGPADAPPAYASERIVPPPSTGAVLDAPAGVLSLPAGGETALRFSVSASAPAGTILWSAQLPPGLQLEAAHGTLSLPAAGVRNVSLRLRAGASLGAGFYLVRIAAVASDGAALEALELPVRVGRGDRNPQLAYVVNRFGNSVTPVDLVTRATLPEIAVGEYPYEALLSRDGTRLYVTDAGENALSVVDLAAGRTVATIRTGTTPLGIAATPDGRTLWIANGDDGTVQALDAATLRTLHVLHVGAQPREIAIAPNGSTLYVSDAWGNAITPVDLRDDTVGVPIAVGLRPAGVALAPGGRRLYVVNTASNDVTPLDLAGSGRRAGPIAVGVAPTRIAVSPNGLLAYVTNHANSTITPIDLRTDTARAPIDVGGAPAAAIFTPDGRTLLVVLARDNALVTVDVASGRVSAPVLLGNGPTAIAGP